jgi:acyl-coenzyme A synthetase/AMP-(fatty) acid ligase
MFFDIDQRKETTVALTESGGRSCTYAEIASFTEKWTDAIKPRSVIFILTSNTIPSVQAYAASLSGGIVPLLLDSKIDDSLLSELTRTYEPAYVWAPAGRDKIPGAVVFGENGYVLRSTGFEPYAVYDELALLLTTSGSTGSPKLVRQSYENIRANTASIVNYLEISETERPITTLPMSYTYGLSIINTHLASGSTILLTDDGVMQRSFWQFFREREATSFGGVPYTYEMLKRLRFFSMELPSLRTMTQAGGKLDPDLHREFAEYALATGKRFFVMYGQTEATARMSYLPWDRALDKYGSMGIAIPGGEFSLVDTNGEEINAPETIGELVYKGKNVTLGYAENKEDLTRGDDWQGVLVTGDMAKRDDEGYYSIVGRKKRFLKIYGNRVNLDETERMIRNEFGSECACAGSDDHMIIFIIDGTIKAKVEAYVSSVTSIHFSAFEVRVIDRIPKNEAGKTLYKELPL